MAREILFKAKRKDNGEWVEGVPIRTHIGLFMCFDENPHYCHQYGYMEIDDIIKVDENTLCQYTGLTDKNGNKIFENDVVKYLADEEFYKCYWDCGNCEYMLVNESGSFGLGYCIGEELEVYGSAFDIGELLGGGE